MGLTRVKVVLRKKKGEKEGYLKIRTTANRQSRYQTLGIKIHQDQWNSKEQEVRKSHPDHDKLNEYIQESVRKHLVHGPIPTHIIGESKDVLNYFLRNIENTTNRGTKNVKLATYKKLKGYLKSVRIKTLHFSDLSADHVQRFYNYLRSEVALNTAGHHIKIFKIVVNRAVKDGVTSPYLTNPFKGVRLKYQEPKIEGLPELEFKNLQQENYFRPNKYLSMFLFSVFAQGMRKSDVMLLRWENFYFQYDKLIMTYTVRKTQSPRKVKLSDMAVYYLRQQVYDHYPELQSEMKDLEDKSEKFMEEARHYGKLVERWSPPTAVERDSLGMQLLKSGEFKDYREAELAVFANAEKYRTIYNNKKASHQEVEQIMYIRISEAIHLLSINKAKDFVFDSLKGQKISKFITDENEYKVFDNKSKLYNYHLRKIGEKVEIKNLHPHLARHTYLSFINESGADLQTIQHLAGHKDPKDTKNYIRRLKVDYGEDVDRNFSDRFRDYN